MSLSNYFEQADKDGNNPLHLKESQWLIDDVAVSASAAEINNAGALLPTTGTHTTNWTGPWAAAQAGNIKYAVIGTLVNLKIPQVQATSTTAATIVNATALPTALRPSAAIEIAIPIKNTAKAIGVLKIDTTGVMTISLDTGGNFGNTGTVGWDNSMSATYNLV